jgi:hypothetical protein
MAYYCKIHGKINVLGRAANHCPLCGKKVFPIFWIPKIYIPIATIWIFLGILAAPVIFCAIYFPVTARMADTDRLVNELPPHWRNLYESLDSVQSTKVVEVTKEFIRVNEKDLAAGAQLTRNNVKVLMRAVDSIYADDVLKLIMPYMAGQ